MLGFLSHWLPWVGSMNRQADQDDMQGLPLPVTESTRKAKWKGRELKLVTGSISHPIPRSSPHSLTGFDVADHQWHYTYTHPSPNRAGPSNVAWIDSSNSVDEQVALAATSWPAPPAVIRLPLQAHVHPIGRSVSSPPTSPSYTSSSSFSGATSPKWNLRLNTDPVFSRSTHSLRLDSRPHTTSGGDVYGHAYNYPLAKQLSPIAEQDYFSPDSLLKTKPLPGNGSTPSMTYSISNTTSPSPGGSQNSEITRPSPSYSISHPFITRQLNRTVSQTSSRTHISSTSSAPRLTSKPSPPSIIPQLNISPPFPGSHPNQNGSGPLLRPRRSTVMTMPTIAGSSESACIEDDIYDDDDDLESLHAESFVTASDAMHGEMDVEMDVLDTDARSHVSVGTRDFPTPTTVPSVHSAEGSRLPSASESFISRRWNRDAGLGSGVVTFRAKRQWNTCTPAFWAFWLGFVCPFLWLVGGWHFTRYGEQPPRVTFWQFYFNAGYWKMKLCGGKRHKLQVDKKGVKVNTKEQRQEVPKWVTEKQSSDDGRMRLHDPKRSLRGISFGYPFVPRPVSVNRSVIRSDVWCISATKRMVSTLEKPNRLFDQLYGVKLKEVRGRPESRRRIFDPWIQRCRYALCYALIFTCVGLCSASTYLIIYNTRQLH